MNSIRMGDIGENPQEWEFEPFTTPAIPEPIAAPVEPVKVPEPVGAPA